MVLYLRPLKLRVDTYGPYFKDLTADLVAEAHNLGLPVCTWTVNEVEDIENMIDIGVDGIITDYTDRAKKIFKSRGLQWQ